MQYTDALLEVRSRLQELTPNFWLDNELYRAINEGVTRFAMEEKWPYLYTVRTGIVLPADQETLELESGVAYTRHFNMLLGFDGDNRLRKPRRIHPSEGYDLRLRYTTNASEPLAYYLYSARATGQLVPTALVANWEDGVEVVWTLTSSNGVTSRTVSQNDLDTELEFEWNEFATYYGGSVVGIDGVPYIVYTSVADVGVDPETNTDDWAPLVDGVEFIAAFDSAVGFGGEYTPAIRFVPAMNREATIEYQYIRNPELAPVGDEGTYSLDVPDEYTMGVCAYAAGHAFLKELSYSQKADEQFALYQKAVQDAKREARKVTPDSGLVWGREEPQYGWTSPDAELLYSIPDTLG